jgi:hypothetical protein
MKQITKRLPLVFLAMFLVAVSASPPAFGHGGGGRVGIYIGAPIGFNFGYAPFPYYRAPYYQPSFYAPAPVYYPPVQQPAQMIYTERRVDPLISTQSLPINTAQHVQNSWWYYCAASKAYYPYVSKCSEGWLRVAPQPELDK